MPVKYLPYGNGKMVSTQWHRVLTRADRDGVRFTLNSGHRTMAEQKKLHDAYLRYLAGGPWAPVAAKPSPTAPHIRVGQPNHALDINSLDGGETRFERWIEAQGASIEWLNTVPGEAWHGEVSREDLARLFRKFRPKPPKTRTGARGVSFIGDFEGLRLEAYKAHPSEKYWTIGYGHYGPDVKKGMKITKARARELLARDLRETERAVVRLVPVDWRREQSKFDALVSIAFNLGPGVLTKEPPLTSLGRALDREATAANARKVGEAMRLYVTAGGQTLPGLVRRRRSEARMFTSGSYSTD